MTTTVKRLVNYFESPKIELSIRPIIQQIEGFKISSLLHNRGYDVYSLILAYNLFEGTPKGWPNNYRLTVARDYHFEFLSCDECQTDNCCGGICVYCEYCGADRAHYVDDRYD